MEKQHAGASWRKHWMRTPRSRGTGSLKVLGVFLALALLLPLGTMAQAAGTPWTGGFNNLSQLGNGTNSASAVPVLVSGLTDVSDLAGDRDHSLAIGAAASCVPPPAGMVAWWSMDEPNGATIVSDLAGFDNQGLPEPVGPLGAAGAPNAVAGKVSGALDFNSNLQQTGPHLEVADHPELNFNTGNLSIDAWVNVPMPPAVYIHPIVDKLAIGAAGTTGYAFYLISSFANGARLLFVMADGGPLANYLGPYLASVPFSTWTHIAVTVNRSSGTVTFFVNGNPLTSTGPAMPAGSIDNGAPLLIGETRLNGMQADITQDEIEMFNRELLQAEIMGIFNAGPAGKCKPGSCTLTCTASASVSSGPAPLAVLFTGGATVSDGSTPYFHWDFGDGDISAEQSPDHTYTTCGTFNWTFTATACGLTCTQTGTVTVAPCCPVISLSPSTLTDGILGAVYSQTISASGGAAPYTYSAGMLSPLPPGLSLSSGGVLSGTPTTAGTYTFTVTATDANGCTGSHTYTITVSETACGQIWGWGYNGSGALGNGTTTSGCTPVQASNITDAMAIEAAWSFSLALRADSSVWFSGMGVLTPVPLPIDSLGTPLSGVQAISAHWQHALALKNDDTVWAWGKNTYGQLGNNSTTDSPYAIPVPILTGVTAISAGGRHSLALMSNGTVWAWGDNASGQLGIGTTVGALFPVLVPSLTGIVAIAAGESHSLALTAGGTIWAWGGNTYGQLGNNSILQSLVPVPVVVDALGTALTNVTAIAAGSSHSLAITGGTAAWAWGGNNAGQLGVGDNIDKQVATSVINSSLTSVSAISAGAYHSLAMGNGNGSVWAWGDHGFGKTGCGTSVSVNAPIAVPNMTDARAISAGTGEGHSLAIVCPSACTLTCTASASVSSGSAPLAVTFTGGATVSDGSTPSFHWAFGDGDSSTVQNPSHTYTTCGTFTWTLTVTACGQTCTETGTVTVSGCCPVISLSPATLPGATMNTFWDVVFSASGGTAPYLIWVTGGALPPGLSLINPATGEIMGTPTTAGTFNFTLTATDARGCTGSRVCSLTIRSCQTISLSPATLPDGSAGVVYDQFITASGGTAPYTYAVAPPLPSNLTLNPLTGEISGVPSTAGTYGFVLTATDASGCHGSHDYSLSVGAGCSIPINLKPGTIAGGTVGAAYTQLFSASGGAVPYAFTTSAGSLPPGLTLNPSTGVISGTPTTAGTYSFTVTATDANKCSGFAQFSLVVGSCTYGPVVVISFHYTGGWVNINFTAVGQVLCGDPVIGVDDDWVRADLIKYARNKGKVKLTFTTNPSATPRSAHVFIGGSVFPVEQAGAPCKVASVSPTKLMVGPSGGEQSFAVMAPEGACEWVASPNGSAGSWLDIPANTGSGNETVHFMVSPNTTGKNRTGTISVGTALGKKNITVKQSP